MSSVELNVYLSKLPEFCEHFQNNKNSVLAKIYGVFTINTESSKGVHVMLMENTTQLKDPNRLTHIFDLKGSSVNRKTKGHIEPSTVLKDTNYLVCLEHANRIGSSSFVTFGRLEKLKLIVAVRKDVAFL